MVVDLKIPWFDGRMETCAQVPQLGVRHKYSLNAKDSAVNEYREIVQRWEDMLAAEGQSVSENYANGRFSLICDLDLSFTRGEFGRVVLGGSPLGEFKLFAILIYVADLSKPLELNMGDKQPVFVLNVESVQGPDSLPIPSLVRLYDIHDEVDDPFGGLMFESAVDGGYKFIPCIAYRKLSVLRPLSCMAELDIVGDKIESGAQVVQSVSSDTHELFWNGFTRLELERVVTSIGISLDKNGVRVSVDADQNSVQVSDVLFGPLNL